jgi:hypothetical protein
MTVRCLDVGETLPATKKKAATDKEGNKTRHHRLRIVRIIA